MLLRAVADPGVLSALSLEQWEVLLSCARRNGVLAYLAERVSTSGIIEHVPEDPLRHLMVARTAAARLGQVARWELERVRRVLQPAGIPLLALKGVAYLLRGMPHAATRLLSDIDVMVPRDRLEAAENLLLDAGWQTTIADAYDQRYYRRWSHELPPLLFPGRLLAVDVHHTICPPVSRLRPVPGRFWADAVDVDDSGVKVLSPVDAVLHAAVHLFFDSDFDGRFRDLLDLHEMLKALGSDETTWGRLVVRAREHGLGRPLYYTLATLRRVLATPIPAAAAREVEAFAPPFPVARWMKRSLEMVLTPIDAEVWPPAHRDRLWLLYVRAHWLRLPAHLLLPHLVRKSLRARAAVAEGG
jgi:hypothetical protein